MNELIKKCQELYQALEKKMLEVANQDLASKQTVEDLKKEAAKLKDIERGLNERSEKVRHIEDVAAALAETKKLEASIRKQNERSEKVRHIEDVAAALAETKKLEASIRKQNEELVRDRTAFIALRDRTMREIADEKEQIAVAKGNNAEAAAKLEAEKAKLVEDRKNMKAQLLADMAKA